MPRSRPVIVAHNISHCEAALAAASSVSVPLMLASARFAASTIGAPAFLAMVEQAATRSTDADFTAAVDCGDGTGYALSALRAGAKTVILDPASPAYARVADIAAQMDARVLTSAVYADALDLSHVGDAAEACHIYLAKSALGGDETS